MSEERENYETGKRPLTYEGRSYRFFFRGRELSPPSPGTYDPEHYTPPTHEYFVIDIQPDGLWELQLGGVSIKNGCDACPTVTAARSIVEQFRP